MNRLAKTRSRAWKRHPLRIADIVTFGGGAVYWYDPREFGSMAQDDGNTTPVAGWGDPVGYIADQSGNAAHATQATDDARPTVQDGYLVLDGVDDELTITVPDPAADATLAYADDFGVQISVVPFGTTEIFAPTNAGGRVGPILYFDRLLTVHETATVEAFLIARGVL